MNHDSNRCRSRSGSLSIAASISLTVLTLTKLKPDFLPGEDEFYRTEVERPEVRRRITIHDSGSTAELET